MPDNSLAILGRDTRKEYLKLTTRLFLSGQSPLSAGSCCHWKLQEYGKTELNTCAMSIQGNGIKKKKARKKARPNCRMSHACNAAAITQLWWIWVSYWFCLGLGHVCACFKQQRTFPHHESHKEQITNRTLAGSFSPLSNR